MTISEFGISLPAIAPSILTADFTRLGQDVVAAERAGAGLLHLDVMDGHFVPNITFGPLVVESLRGATRLPLDVHLMIEEPERFVDAFADAGADIITVHVEATRHLHRVIQWIHARSVRAGVALNPATPIAAIEEVVAVVDMVLVMSVNPGFGGQSFIPSTLGRLSRLRDMFQPLGTGAPIIEVDGGIQPSNARRVVDAGGQVLVAGSSVFNDDQTVDQAMSALLSSVRK
jgi:ribulose-phosphate 3-epimerase